MFWKFVFRPGVSSEGGTCYNYRQTLRVGNERRETSHTQSLLSTDSRHDMYKQFTKQRTKFNISQGGLA